MIATRFQMKLLEQQNGKRLTDIQSKHETMSVDRGSRSETDPIFTEIDSDMNLLGSR